MSTAEIIMTDKEKKVYDEELDQLKTVRRKEVTEKIKVARGFGDLSENSEYDAAKEEQAFVESRINELEHSLKHAKVIDTSKLTFEEIAVGVHVQLENERGALVAYDITGITSDPLNGKISMGSPVSQGLLGKKVGETAEITLPNGRTIEYKVIAITKQD